MPSLSPRRSVRAGRAVVAAAAWLLSTAAPAELVTGTDADAQLPFWEWREPGMSLRLVQRLPDQSRAFFLARGFSRDDVELIAQSCVFQTVFKNLSTADAPAAIDYDLRDWVVRSGAETRGMKTREDWAETWARREVPKAARIAFEWALFPTRQTYNAGDYNWGMSVFDLAPGDTFDLVLHWSQGGVRRTATLRGMRCAPDEDVATGEAP